MAEHFYSLHPDDATVFMNFNAGQHRHQLPNNHPHLPGVMAAPETDFYSNCAYVRSADYAAIDHNNNNNNNNNNNSSSTNWSSAAFHYFANNANHNNTNNNVSFNALPPGVAVAATSAPETTANMMVKYTGSGEYTQAAVMLNDGNAANANVNSFRPSLMPMPQHTAAAAVAAAAAAAAGCHYAISNGNNSCYTRNRYAPYSHNRVCAAAAAAAAAVSAAPNNLSAVQAAFATASMNFKYQQQQQQKPQQQLPPHQQQFAAIYNTCPNGAVNVPRSVESAPMDLSYDRALASNLDGFAAAALGGSLGGSLVAVGAPLDLSVANAAEAARSDMSSNSSTAGSVVKAAQQQQQQSFVTVADPSQTVTLQITNLDYSMDEASLRNFLMKQLSPITPVVSLVFEGSSYAKVTVPDLYFAKQVVSFLHRKKIGHKRMLVSYTRDSSLTEINTLRCQVAGLLKDVPFYTLPMYKFRELFQSRFKTSISVIDLYRMHDICAITTDTNDEKFIRLQPELINSLENSPLMEGLQHSVPYCTVHFKREHQKGWAEQDIEPLPNVCMTIAEIQKIVYPLLKSHLGDIPVASLLHCIEAELSIKVKPDERGVNLEHLVCCVPGIQILTNNFGIKILSCLDMDKSNAVTGAGSTAPTVIHDRSIYAKNSNSNSSSNSNNNNSMTDPLHQISREVVELVKMSPKATMKFNRFIPAYHNHFGKQCRVADYGYTKLIELFEALSTVVQIMGDGENRQITLTHRTQIRRFNSDLLRILRTHGNKSVLLSELPLIFAQTQNRNFEVTDYGVCDIVDILDGLVTSNIVVVTTVAGGKDIIISIPKRKQTNSELEKTSIFAGEMVELFRNAPQYTILFQKFVRSYHYHFAYQCRLSDYGFLKLADLMEAIQGVVQLELTNDEDKKVSLSPRVAQRVFAEQCEELIRCYSGCSQTPMQLDDVLELHKKKFGYQIQPQTLGVQDFGEAVQQLPYVETFEKEDGSTVIVCHNDDAVFRTHCYRGIKLLLAHGVANSSSGGGDGGALKPETKSSSPKAEKAEKAPISMPLQAFLQQFNKKHSANITEQTVKAMKHALEIVVENEISIVRISKFMTFLMNIVRLLEQRPSLVLHDLKTALDCGVSTCFEFGYPNLFSVLSAYNDVFTMNAGVVRELCEVSLLPTTELRLSAFVNHQHLFGSLKLPSLKQKPPARPSRNPLSDYNRCPNQPTAPKNHRAPSNDSTFPAALSQSNNNSNNYKNVYNNNNNYYNHQQAMNKQLYAVHQQQQQQQQCSLKAVACDNNYNSNNNFNNSSTTYATSNLLNSTCLNLSSNKENSFNSSFNMFNNSLNSSSSNSSFGEVNTSCGSKLVRTPTTAAAAGGGGYSMKLWDRRHPNSGYYQPVIGVSPERRPSIMQQSAVMSSAFVGAAQPPQTLKGADQTSLYDFVNDMQMRPMYGPPKPDTPPSDNVPFWIDPIWTNTNGFKASKNNESLNIKLPEFKSLNVFPMLLSPYTLSKTENMKQPVFNFENHDRKIA